MVAHIIKIIIIVLLPRLYVVAGQNEATAISIDLNFTQSGNQKVTSIAPQYFGYNLYLEIRVDGASNLDTYEFYLNYPSLDFTYKNTWSDNFPPSSEQNILKTAGGSPIVFKHQLTVRFREKGLQGDYQVNGYQTKIGISCHALTASKKLQFKFDDYLHGNLYPDAKLKKGKPVLTLSRGKGGTYDILFHYGSLKGKKFKAKKHTK